MNTRAVVAIGVGVVAGIIGAVYLKRFLDRELPEVAQFPDNESGVDPELRARIQEAVMDPSTRIHRGRPQRHEEMNEDVT